MVIEAQRKDREINTSFKQGNGPSDLTSTRAPLLKVLPPPPQCHRLVTQPLTHGV